MILNTAQRFKEQLDPQRADYYQQMTTLHTLYERAAEAFGKEDNLTAAFHARALAATEVIPTPRIHQLSMTIENIQTEGTDQLQAYIENLDSGTLKHAEIKAARRVIDSARKIQVNFRLNQPARNKLTTTIDAIRQNHSIFMNALTGSLDGCPVEIEEITDGFLIRQRDFSFSERDKYTPQNDSYGTPSALRIRFGDVGEVVIGTNPKFGCLYESVRVIVRDREDRTKATTEIHQMLSMLGLGPILTEQRAEDKERMKLAQLFHTFYPREAIKIEQQQEFYELPCETVKQKIVTAAPGMSDIISEYNQDPQFIKEVALPQGRKVFTIPKIALELRHAGATHLMHGITGDDTQRVDKVIGILRHGLLSSMERFQAGLIALGASSLSDMASGGGGHVFTRLVTTETQATMFHAMFSRKYIILISLDAACYGAYCYPRDNFGVRNPHDKRYKTYAERPSLLELPSCTSEKNTIRNEVMIPSTIPPHFIQHIVCINQQSCEALIRKLEEENLIQNGEIMGRPVNEFIYVHSQK